MPPKKAVPWILFAFLISGCHGIGRQLPAFQALAQLRSLKSTSVADIRKALIQAVPGVTYPMHSRIPKTSFSCSQVYEPGFYADPEADCQLYHRCLTNPDAKFSFLCPNATLFNQITLVCDWWYNVDCSKVESFYSYSNPRLQAGYSGNFLDDESTPATYHSDVDYQQGETEESSGTNEQSEDSAVELQPAESSVVVKSLPPSDPSTSTTEEPDEVQTASSTTGSAVPGLLVNAF